MARVYNGATVTELMHSAMRDMLNDPKPDAVLNIESHFYDVSLCADTGSYELDVGKELWLNRSRWSRLIKEYVPAAGLEIFLGQCREIYSGESRQGATTCFTFREPERYAKKHRWGGCLLSATFRGCPKYEKPTLTFHSRTTYVGYMGMLDAAIGHCVASQICGDAEAIAFRWHISSAQLHCFKSLPFIFSQPDLLATLVKATDLYTKDKAKAKKTLAPTWYNLAAWYFKVLRDFQLHGVDMLKVEKYGPFKRIKRRWLEHQGHLAKHIPPSLMPCDLDFEKAM